MPSSSDGGNFNHHRIETCGHRAEHFLEVLAEAGLLVGDNRAELAVIPVGKLRAE